MRRIVLPLLVVCTTLAVSFVPSQPQATQSASQGSEHIIDGIGETALVARYILNGTTEDSSRNQLHARVQGIGAVFVDDPGGRKVLLITGDGSHLQLPSGALDGEDVVTVVAWLYLPTGASGPVFEFGTGAGDRIGAGVDAQGFRASVVSGGRVAASTPPAPTSVNEWHHLAVVFDPAQQTLTSHLDGVRVGHVTGVNLTLETFLPQHAVTKRLLIGRAIDDRVPSLHGRLRDVRIYRTVLGDDAIATIRRNALPASQPAQGRSRPQPEISAADIPVDSPFAATLTAVPPITVETVVGTLPHLPPYVPATIAGGSRGTIRVIWPAPTDNLQVRAPGTFTITGRVPGTIFAPTATVVVKARAASGQGPDRVVETFPLDRVTLDRDALGRDTPFIKNRDKFLRGLAASNPDNFLYNFREAFGQPQPEGVTPLGGWDSQTTKLRGHATGHYLTAIAQAYASTGYDPALRAVFQQKMVYLVETLADLAHKSGRPAGGTGPFVADPKAVPVGPGRVGYDSNLRAGAIRTDYWNWGLGFISAYPPDQFIMLERGATYGTQDSQIWAPYYTLHKILAGLLDVYEVAGNKKALDVATGMGAWVHTRLAALPAETRSAMWSRYIAGEYGGMNEAMARLYRLTGDQRFLETARLFDNTVFFYGNAAHDHGLARGVDTVRGRHANQHIPQIAGALETYRTTHELPYYRVAANFWEIVTSGYMYSIGGVAGARHPNNAECFTAQPDTLWENGFAAGGQNETCATYNMLKLDRQLFAYEQTARYMDHYERALYNHILASVAETDAGNTYHVPLNPGAQKRFNNASMDGFTCCNGTALESHTKLQDSIYFQSADRTTLYVNLFIPSTLTWSERQVSVRQVTSFPYADTTTLTVQGRGRFTVKIRVPAWATRGFFVRINDRDAAVKAEPGTYLALSRVWNDGDTIRVRMPFSFHLDPVMDQPNVASVFYGPVLLAAEESGPRTDWRKLSLVRGDIGRSIAGDPSTLRFQVDGAVLKPFYETYGRHSVYVHVAFK